MFPAGLPVIRLRLLHPGRIIWRRSLRHDCGTRSETWMVFRWKAANWVRIFGEACRWMWIEYEPSSHGLRLADQAGRIEWHDRRAYATITIELRVFSPKKQELVVATLRKAARFDR